MTGTEADRRGRGGMGYGIDTREEVGSMTVLERHINGRARAERIEMDVHFGSVSLRDRYRSVKVYVVHITPSLAEIYLQGNVKNRPLNKFHVDHMRQVLESGDMLMNGETIIIGVDGTLLNGQHRLTACVQSGIGFDAMVVDGIDLDAFRTLDGGRRRSTGDVLAIDGEAMSNKLAAAIQALVSFVDRGGRQMLSSGGTCVRKVTPQLADRVLERHSRIRESVSSMAKSKLYANQHGYLLHYLFSVVSQSLANDFAEILCDGHEDIGRPFVVFRETLIANHNYSHLRNTNAAKAIKAFNAERTGQRPKLLRLHGAEEFPRIDGLDYDALFASVK